MDMTTSDRLVIRTGLPTDATALAGFGAATFRSTYAADAPTRALDAFVGRLFGDGVQAAELADPARRFLMAELGGDLVGYLLLHDTTAPPGVPGDRPLLIDRFYVDVAVQGQGIGRALLDRAVRHARSRDYDPLWLSVWEQNHRAAAIYRRWGFVDVGEVGFDLAGVPQTDRLMARPCRVAGDDGSA
jgi:diamine N-acetyltransferase